MPDSASPSRARSHAVIPAVFVVLGLVTSLLCAVLTPPFMAADELTHLNRADMLTFGFAGRHQRSADGQSHFLARVHISNFDAAAPFDRVKFRPDQKVTAADMAAAGALRLDARLGDTSPAASVNPLLYAPPALAVGLGRHFGWQVVTILYVARMITALTCVAIGALALWRTGNGQTPMFALLMLPMAQALNGAVSQDGLVIGLTALGVAGVSRAMSEDRPMRIGEWALSAFAFAMVAAAKPPYALMFVLLLAAPCVRPGLSRLAIGLGVALAAGWTAWTLASGWSPILPSEFAVDPGAQAARLMRDPGQVVSVALQSFHDRGQAWREGFIGVLGWLDTRLAEPFYVAAYVALLVAFAASVGAKAPRAWLATRWLAPLIVLVIFGVMAGAFYLTWTPVGARVVDGIQGRYLIPPALLLTLLVAGVGPASTGLLGRGRQALAAAVCAFPVVSLLVVAAALVERFYLG